MAGVKIKIVAVEASLQNARHLGNCAKPFKGGAASTTLRVRDVNCHCQSELSFLCFVLVFMFLGCEGPLESLFQYVGAPARFHQHDGQRPLSRRGQSVCNAAYFWNVPPEPRQQPRLGLRAVWHLLRRVLDQNFGRFRWSVCPSYFVHVFRPDFSSNGWVYLSQPPFHSPT